MVEQMYVLVLINFIIFISQNLLLNLDFDFKNYKFSKRICNLHVVIVVYFSIVF